MATDEEWTPDFVMDTAFWTKTWSKGGAKSFHLPYIAGWFEKYVDTLLAGRKGVKVLVPFCGKDVCMKWLVDHGHQVVGIECVEQGCREFFEEQKIEYTTEKKGNFTVFKNEIGTMKLYCGDFLDFTPELEGKFGAIWDRGALNTVNGFQRKDYVALMASLMTPETIYILIVFDSEDKKITEEWDLLTDDKLSELFGDKFDIQHRVEYSDAASQNEGLDPKEMEGLWEKLAIIRLK